MAPQWVSLVASALLVLPATAHLPTSPNLQSHVFLRAIDVLERSYADLDHVRTHLRKRQQQTFESNVTLNPDGTVNMAAWNDQTEAACQDALSQLPSATNPSGTCICYNLPSLDTATGVFEADLRVYKINEPNGAFLGIRPENIQVGLSYTGASVSMVNQRSVAARDVVAGDIPTALVRRVTNPIPLQQYLFVGQIDQTRMSTDMTMAQLEALVMPVLTLTGVSANGDRVSTNVSSNEAVFVSGVFSSEVVMSDFAAADAAVNKQLDGLRTKEVAFVLPGVQILIFPIGLVITSVWLVLGVAAYGYGTYQRIGYAESFKRRKAMAASSVKTI